MSRITSPPEKKHASLTRDRRNTYGESPHGARKNIPRRKAEQHQQERRAANLTLNEVLSRPDPDSVESIEVKAETHSKLKRLRGFKKVPDEPLGEVIERKRKQGLRQAAGGE